MWDMIRVDHGTEYALMLYTQTMLKDNRGNQHCEPYMQTRSCQVSKRENTTFGIIVNPNKDWSHSDVVHRSRLQYNYK